MKTYISRLVICLTLALTCAPNHASTQSLEALSAGSDAYVSGLTSGRARSLIGGFVGLLSMIIGWRARKRSTSQAGFRRPWAIAALILGIIAIVLSVIHLTGTTGTFGTGGGKAGAIVALILGVGGCILSGIAARHKKF